MKWHASIALQCDATYLIKLRANMFHKQDEKSPDANMQYTLALSARWVSLLQINVIGMRTPVNGPDLQRCAERAAHVPAISKQALKTVAEATTRAAISYLIWQTHEALR